MYQLEAAWNAADSTSFAALFAEDADFIHILGGYYTGRAAIEAGHRMIFGTIYKGSSSAVQRREDSVSAARCRDRFSSPVSAVSKRAELRRELEARPTIIAEKADGSWRIAALQNTRITEAGAVPK